MWFGKSMFCIHENNQPMGLISSDRLPFVWRRPLPGNVEVAASLPDFAAHRWGSVQGCVEERVGLCWVRLWIITWAPCYHPRRGVRRISSMTRQSYIITTVLTAIYFQIDHCSLRCRNCNSIFICQVALAGNSEETFRLWIKLPAVCQTRSRLHIVLFLAERQVGKL